MSADWTVQRAPSTSHPMRAGSKCTSRLFNCSPTFLLCSRLKLIGDKCRADVRWQKSGDPRYATGSICFPLRQSGIKEYEVWDQAGRKHCPLVPISCYYYEECRLLGYNNPVCTSQETHYVSATESSQLMLGKIWGFHGSDYEECRLLGYKTQFVPHRRHITSPLQSPAS
jgi:hypothetical protein